MCSSNDTLSLKFRLKKSSEATVAKILYALGLKYQCIPTYCLRDSDKNWIYTLFEEADTH